MSARSSLALALLAAALPAAPVFAQQPAHPTVELDDDWKAIFDGQIRPRWLIDSGRDFIDDEFVQRQYFTQRARLGTTFEHHGGVAATLRLQDTRIWGEELDTLNDASGNGVDVHEAFGVIPIGDEVKLKLGRQELSFDNQRLIGPVDWTQRGRSFDAARLTWTHDAIDLDFFYARVSEADLDKDGAIPSTPAAQAARTDDTDAAGTHLTWRWGKGHTLALAYYLRNDKQADETRHTPGLILSGGMSGFAYSGEFYYQFGSLAVPDKADPAQTTNQDVSAMLGALSAGYTFDVTAKPGFKLWGEYLAGDGTKQGTFDTLYATNHMYYGEMDFFLLIPKDTGGYGLTDAGGRFFLSPVAGLTTLVDAHFLRTVEAIGGENGLGAEIDVKAIWAVMNYVNVQLLYGVFLPGQAMADVRGLAAGADPATEHFIYLTTDVKF